MQTRVLGRYELLGELGKGGMGVVYRAKHTQLGKTVALKILSQNLAQTPTPLARFVREARAVASLEHPNIVQVFDVDHVDDTHFFAMEFVEGETLGQRIKSRGTIPVAEAIHIVRQIAEALAFAHRRGVVHRDLKPANIMLDLQGRVKVMDFGIAAAVGTENLTLTGEILGTPSYMSPEQALDQEVDGRSDLFSLGVTLCEMLTGRGPLHGLSVVSAVGKLIQPGKELDLELPPEVPPGLRAIISRLVRKQPGQRYGSAAELIADLDALEREGEAMTVAARLGAAGPVPAGALAPDSTARRVFPARFARQHRLELGSAALVAAALAMLLWGRGVGRREDGRGQPTAGAPAEMTPAEVTPPEVTPPEVTPPGTPGEGEAVEGKPPGGPPWEPLAGAQVRPFLLPPPPDGAPPNRKSGPRGTVVPPLPANTPVPQSAKADSSRVACEQSRQAARGAGAEQLAADSYAKAQTSEAKAMGEYAAGRFEWAAAGFATAAGLFRESRDQAMSVAARVARLRESVETARRQAEGAGAQGTASYAQGQEGEKILSAAMSDPPRAFAAAALAESLYALSVLEHAADLSRKEMEEERTRVQEARNPLDAGALRRAREHENEGQAAYRTARFAEAKSKFERARDEYRLARARADRR